MSAAGPALLCARVVLLEPQNDINIGAVVRACKNFGAPPPRVVRPRVGDPDRIAVSAAGATECVPRIERFETLADALADCHYVVGATARARRGARAYLEPRALGAALAERPDPLRSAILFGREDSGLPNDALDRCDAVVCIPTRPEHTSLNLAQAALLILYEAFLATEHAPGALVAGFATEVRGKQRGEPAAARDVDAMLEALYDLLADVEFLRGAARPHMEGVLRRFFSRAGLDTREVAIWRGVVSQVRWGLARRDQRADS